MSRFVGFLLAASACGSPPTEQCSPSQRETVYADADGDGAGDPATEQQACSLADGQVTVGGDCDDADPGVNPLETELCDGVDQDCDGEIDDGLSVETWYADVDGDGFGTANYPISACAQPPDSSRDATDCDDAHADAHPGAVEVCDGYDDDCDFRVDDTDDSLDRSTTTAWYDDVDGDGFGDDDYSVTACVAPNPYLIPTGGDCDDANASIHPNSAETCDGVDDDCDGDVDADDADLDPASLLTWYADLDNDGKGDDSTGILACFGPPGWVTTGGDCDDGDPRVLDPQFWFADNDQDGVGAGGFLAGVPSCDPPVVGAAPGSAGVDCNDFDASIHPGAFDACDDGVDQDCLGGDAICSNATCGDLYAQNPGGFADGVYSIEPVAGGGTYDVWCDMTTDGGGWTLVMSDGASALPVDAAGPFHGELATLYPASAHPELWDGLRPAVGATHDVRFACKVSTAQPSFDVDLSFYDVDWYLQATVGIDDFTCLDVGGVAVFPNRRNNLTSVFKSSADAYDSGLLEIEDACNALDDFTVDFDDRGKDSDETDGTDWGSDDSMSKCGFGPGESFFVFVR